MEHARINVPPAGDQALSNRADIIRERLSSALRLVDEIVDSPAARPGNPPVTERKIRAILNQRRNRDRFFDSELFADPAWDILLELYAAELGQQRMAVSNVCTGASVPATTALRWVKLLEKKQLIERKADPRDGRRIFLSLSRPAVEAMDNYFATVSDPAQLI